MNKNNNILIVGLGLIGGSYAKKLTHMGYNVFAIDKDIEAIRYAKENMFIKNKDETDIELIKIADLIVMCIYPLEIVNWIKTNSINFKNDTIITDVAGVKRNLVKEINELNLVNCEYIGSHPIAGREKQGVIYSEIDLFNNANFILTPFNNTKRAINMIIDLASVLGFKNIEILSPEYHDELIGYLSQLPHAIAVALMNSHDSKEYIKYTGDSFRDLTRIAKINEDLWSELFLINKDYLINEINSFMNELKDLNNYLINNDKSSLIKKFIQAKKSRQLFDKK